MISLIYTLFINSPFEYLSTSASKKSFSSKYVSDIAPFAYKLGISFFPGKKAETPLAGLLETAK